MIIPKTLSSSLTGTPIEIADIILADNMRLKNLQQVSLTTGFFSFSGLIFVKKGRFSISIPQQNMSTLYSYIVETGMWFGGLSLMPIPQPFLLINEIETVELYYLSRQKIIALADNNPLIYKWLLEMAAKNIPQWFQAPLISFSSKHIRVIYCLATLVPLTGNKNGAIELSITQQELSNICGLSRPRVNEVLKKLEEENILKNTSKKITILNMESIFSLLDDTNLSFYDPRTKTN